MPARLYTGPRTTSIADVGRDDKRTTPSTDVESSRSTVHPQRSRTDRRCWIRSSVLPVRHVFAARAHIHERHQLGGHDNGRAHHVVVFVFEDVAVVHVAPAEDREADHDVDDFVGIDANGAPTRPRHLVTITS